MTPHGTSKKIQVGDIFLIGKPANETYLYLKSSMPTSKQLENTVALSPHKLIGKIVAITGIVRHANSPPTYIVGRQDQKAFYKGLDKIYTDLENALVAKEILAI